jgi:acyl carrier protein
VLRDDIKKDIFKSFEKQTSLKIDDESKTFASLNIDATDILMATDEIEIKYNLKEIKLYQVKEWTSVTDMINAIEEMIEEAEMK